MYGYEYEFDVLAILRILKYLHTNRPNALEDILRFYEKLDIESIEEMAYNAMWEIFDVVDFIVEEDGEMESVRVSDWAFDRFIELGRQMNITAGNTNSNAHQKKFQDTVEYYLCSNNNSIFDMRYEFEEESVEVVIWLSLDCFEPLMLANAMIDLILALEQENEQMEIILRKQNNIVTAMSEERMAA